jgi:hypothetical protein
MREISKKSRMTRKVDAELAKEYNRQRVLVDDYLASVYGLQALILSALWDESIRSLRASGRSSTHRSMTPSDPAGSSDLTPDAVIQVDDTYGIVAEMKKHFAAGKLEHFEQVKTYDSNLIGWWTPDERIQAYDLVLMTHYFSKADAADTYSAWRKTGRDFSRPFAIISFTHSEQASLYFALERVEGKLSDHAHDESLRKVKRIPGAIAKELIYSKYKFYDAEPPESLTMLMILTYVVPAIPPEEEFDRVTGKKGMRVEVTIERVLEELRKYCPGQSDRRDKSLPRREWVDRALGWLVKLELCAKVDTSPPRYVFPVSPNRKRDVLEYISERIVRHERKKSQKESENLYEQGELFEAK